MTPYETASLLVAKQALWTSWGTLIVAIVGGGIALYALVALKHQVTVAVSQLHTSRWDMLLSFEQDMASRRATFARLAAELSKSTQEPLFKERYEEAKESYLNAVDRLASSILNGHFDNREMKQDYRNVIRNVIKEFPEEYGPASPYRKTKKLHDSWEDEAS